MQCAALHTTCINIPNNNNAIQKLSGSHTCNNIKMTVTAMNMTKAERIAVGHQLHAAIESS